MEGDPPPLFDAHLHPEGLTDQDIESLRIFGVSAALVAAHHAAVSSTPREILAHFESILAIQLPRLERQGIRAYAALGVDPRCVPRRGMTEILAALPDYFSSGKVVALGEVGLQHGGEAEENAFIAQLELSRKLKLPVLVHTPVLDKERLTRRTLNILKAAGVVTQRVMVDHASPRTVRTILECGHYAGLTIHPDELSAERATALVRRLGSERIIVDSDLGDGPGDIIGLPRMVNLMAKQKLSAGVIHKVAFKNAAHFFRVASGPQS
jgi:predicted metal-dependent TIM-barrel fold hydrolase